MDEREDKEIKERKEEDVGDEEGVWVVEEGRGEEEVDEEEDREMKEMKEEDVDVEGKWVVEEGGREAAGGNGRGIRVRRGNRKSSSNRRRGKREERWERPKKTWERVLME